MKILYDNIREYFDKGRYSSGRRGGPAKAVGRATGARVQIPLFPPSGTAFAHAVLLFLSKRHSCNYNTKFKRYK